MGDFNEVCLEQERYGSVFNVQSATALNNFISLANLIDLPFDGYAYTWVHKSANKMSKLDRFLISKGLMASFPHLSVLCLDKHLSDHRPTLMREMNIYYGPTPFRFFHSWFQLDGFDKLVEDTWMHLNIKDSNGMIKLKKKLQALKIIIKEWSKNAKKCGSNEAIINDRSIILKKLQDIISMESKEVAQKAKVRWAIEGTFPKGCTSSFIALIPKIHNAKTVKDLCPISLIGSMYKIIAKILANRLSFIIADLISDVQSAFVSNRQILDGPFILNELLSWCKYKKFKATVFKVDFEKGFDLIRWDYLDDALKKFGFSDKWCGWINSCLKSAKGSVLVNGSPTPEFQFHKGLKQGDPLSPFLFILTMESLHLSFKRVMNAGLFTGIPLDNSLTISHLFYADDAIFVGKWDTSNIKIILNVLKCFHMASGLLININKSKLIGIVIHSKDMSICSLCYLFRNPFSSTTMGDENPIRTLGDYSKPSHEGYRNTIELPVGNNVVPLRSDTIRLVQNGCSFHGLRSEDPNQHLKDFLKLVDSLDLDGENRERTRLRLFQFSLRDQASNWLERLPAGSITTWEDLTTRFLA
ncbi:RNA-directed DNA polymerase, eukaryota [Tanacetum coccineum]